MCRRCFHCHRLPSKRRDEWAWHEWLKLLFSSVQFRSSSVQFSSVQFSSVQISSVQFSSVQFSSVQFSSVQFSSVQFSSVQFSSVQFSSVQFSSVQFSSVQFSSVQSSPVQSSPVQSTPWFSSVQWTWVTMYDACIYQNKNVSSFNQIWTLWLEAYWATLLCGMYKGFFKTDCLLTDTASDCVIEIIELKYKGRILYSVMIVSFWHIPYRNPIYGPDIKIHIWAR